MAKEDDGTNPEQEPNEERRFSQEQYDFLKKCTEKGKEGIKEWNQWRIDNPDEGVLLEKAFLNKFDLRYAWLNKGKFVDESSGKEYEFTGEVILTDSQLQDAILEGVNLQGANLWGANLQGADLFEASLKSTTLWRANLQGARLTIANLQGADLWTANLQGADLSVADLQGADFTTAIVDSRTLIWLCEVNHYSKKEGFTDFEGVDLESVRIDPGTKQLLEYNKRRKNWENWYKGDSEKKWVIKMRGLATSPIRLFWSMSDYGRSTGRIILTFFVLAFLFTFVYWFVPNCVMVNGKVGDIRSFIHALYFSVVTMTTLGFGDIAANPDSWQGQILLMIQVILGYILLGALVTRFAVLFTAGGPAGRFVPMDKETKQLLEQLRQKENTP